MLNSGQVVCTTILWCPEDFTVDLINANMHGLVSAKSGSVQFGKISLLWPHPTK